MVDVIEALESDIKHYYYKCIEELGKEYTLPLDKIGSLLETLESAGYGELKELCCSRTSTPVWLFEQDKEKDRRALIVSRIYGSHVNSTLVGLSALRLPSNYNLSIVPVLNPDATKMYEKRMSNGKKSSNGADFWKDFSRLEEPEVIACKKEIDGLNDEDLFITITDTSWPNGTSLRIYSNDSPVWGLARGVLEDLKEKYDSDDLGVYTINHSYWIIPHQFLTPGSPISYADRNGKRALGLDVGYNKRTGVDAMEQLLKQRYQDVKNP